MWFGRFIIIKISFVPQSVYKLNTKDFNQIPRRTFGRNWQDDSINKYKCKRPRTPKQF